MGVATEILTAERVRRPALRGQGAERRRILTAGAVLVAVVCTLFTSLYWNRFLAPSAGATSFYAAEQMLHGKMPYRDFLFLVPALHALKLAALIELFGHTLAVARFEGLLERTIIAVLLYLWLARFCRVAPTVLAVLFAMVMFAGDPADSVSSYHHDSVFWAVAAGLCASLYLDRGTPATAVLAGVFGACSFLTKQTTGIGVIGAVLALVAILEARNRGPRAAARFGALFALGVVIPNSAFLGWLYREQALGPFLANMSTMSSSKGSAVQVLTRPVGQFGQLFAFVALITAVMGLQLVRARGRWAPENLRSAVVVAGGAGASVLLAFLSVSSRVGWPGQPLTWASVVSLLAQWSILEFAITGSAFIFIHHTVRLWRQGLSAREQQVWMAGGVSLAIAYMLALSFAVYSPMAVPGVALVAALALDRLEASNRIAAGTFAALLCVLIYAGTGSKLVTPYSWMSWSEPPVTAAVHESQLPLLRGLRISERTLSITEKVTALVQENTPEGGTLLVYPYFPLFYLLTGRHQPGYLFNHYIDVCPDAVCREEAALLDAKPPDAIIYMVEDEESLKADEGIFRAGARSGSRDLAAAIEKLVKNYRKLYTFTVPGSSRVVDVYSRL